MVFITCGRSVRSAQYHSVERNNSMFRNLPRLHPVLSGYELCVSSLLNETSTAVKRDRNRVNLPGPESRPEPELIAGSEAAPLVPVPEPEINRPQYPLCLMVMSLNNSYM